MIEMNVGLHHYDAVLPKVRAVMVSSGRQVCYLVGDVIHSSVDEAAEYLGYVVSGSRCILNLSLYLVRAA